MKLNGIDLNKLVIFSTVAKHGGYRGASEELSLTRSAISQAITNLESLLGKQLFNRVGARLRLTESAEKLFHELTVHHQNLQTSLATFTQKNNSLTGQLRIGAYLEFTKSKLMPVVEEYMLANPHVQLKFIFESPSRIHSLLENDRIDLSVSIFPHRNSKSIESRKLCQEELVLIGRSDLVSQQPKRTLLAKVPVVDYFSTHVLFKRWWYQQFSQHIKNVNIVTYAATAEMVYELVRRRAGVGVVPRYVFDSANNDDRVHIIQPTGSRLFDYVWLSQFKKKNRDPVHTEFLNLLNRRFS